MQDLHKDLSTLTGLPIHEFTKLTQKTCALVNHYVMEAIKTNNDKVEIDLGIGYLYLQLTKDNVSYKFVPSKRMIMNVKDAYQDKKNNLVDMIEKNMVNKVMNTYKELL